MQEQKSVGSTAMQLSEEWVFQEEGASHAKALRWEQGGQHDGGELGAGVLEDGMRVSHGMTTGLTATVRSALRRTGSEGKVLSRGKTPSDGDFSCPALLWEAARACLWNEQCLRLHPRWTSDCPCVDHGHTSGCFYILFLALNPLLRGPGTQQVLFDRYWCCLWT